MAFAPFFLAYHGAPTLAETLVFALGLAPLIAAMVVARSGRIVTGYALLFAGLLGFGLMLCLDSAAGPGPSMAWLVLAQWEAGRANNRRLDWISGLLSCAAFCLVIVVTRDGYGQGTPSISALLTGGLALAYAMTAAPLPAPRSDAVAQQPASLQADRFVAFCEAMGDLIVRFDGGGSVIDVNSASERIVGLPTRDVVGRGLFQIVHIADRPTFLKLIADATQSGMPHTSTIRLRAHAEPGESGAFMQRFLWVEMRVCRLRGIGTATPEVVAVLRDVTDSHPHDTEAETARQSEASSSRSKEDFLANMSHELRTPLNAIIGFSEMLGSRTLRPAETDRQCEYARIIHQSGQHLLSVVNSILDMSKIQSGTFSIITEPFDLRPLIDQCCDILRLKAQDGRVEIKRHYPETMDDVVGDKRAYKQILINLLSNAVKFTPERGEVSVRVMLEGTAVLIMVSDSGIGIGVDDLARIGDPFFQARSSFDRPYEGTGLGLSVVRGLISLHGGTMNIESEPAKGTRVMVRLPINCPASAGSDTTATIETIPRRPPPDAPARNLEPKLKSIA